MVRILYVRSSRVTGNIYWGKIIKFRRESKFEINRRERFENKALIFSCNIIVSLFEISFLFFWYSLCYFRRVTVACVYVSNRKVKKTV